MKKLINLILKFWGYQLFPIPKGEIRKLTEEFCEQVQNKYTDVSGEWKRTQVLRMLMNRFPEEKETTLNLSIELYVSSK